MLVENTLTSNLIPVPLTVAIEVGLHLVGKHLTIVHPIQAFNIVVLTVGMQHRHKVARGDNPWFMSIMLPKCVTKVNLLPHSLPCEGATVLNCNAVERVLPLQLGHHLGLLLSLTNEEPEQNDDNHKHHYRTGIHNQGREHGESLY